MKITQLTLIGVLTFWGLFANVSAQNAQVGLTITEVATLQFPQGGGASHFSLSGPQLGITWQNRFLNSHEVKLSGMSFGFSGQPRNAIVGLGAKYQYRHFLFKEKTEKLKPFVLAEVGLGLGYNRQEFSQNGVTVPRTNLNISSSLAVGPGVRWNVSEKMYLDFALPVTFSGANFGVFNNVQGSNSSVATSNFSLRPANARLEAGLGIFLWNKKAK